VSDAGSASNGYEMVGIPDGLGATGGPRGGAVRALLLGEPSRRHLLHRGGERRRRPPGFLFDAQVHKANPEPGMVEHGQLMTLRVKSWKAVFSGG
jgi:hypothetical protein